MDITQKNQLNMKQNENQIKANTIQLEEKKKFFHGNELQFF